MCVCACVRAGTRSLREDRRTFLNIVGQHSKPIVHFVIKALQLAHV